MPHVEHHVLDRLGVHDFRALVVDDLALVVHHVVVLDDLLADFVIASFDLALRRLDSLRKPLRADRLAILQIGVHHLGEQRVGSEDTQQIVFETEVEPRQSRVALTARPAAQLVVDPTRFVPLGAEDEQSASVQHLPLLGFDLGLDPGNLKILLVAVLHL